MVTIQQLLAELRADLLPMAGKWVIRIRGPVTTSRLFSYIRDYPNQEVDAAQLSGVFQTDDKNLAKMLARMVKRGRLFKRGTGRTAIYSLPKRKSRGTSSGWDGRSELGGKKKQVAEDLEELRVLVEADSPLRVLQRKLKAVRWMGRRAEQGARHTYTNREGNDQKWAATIKAFGEYASALDLLPVSHVRATETKYYISRTTGDTSRPHLYAILGHIKKDGYDPGFVWIDPQWTAIRKLNKK